jgi:hypothetical protein
MPSAGLVLKYLARPVPLPIFNFVGSHARADVNVLQKGRKPTDDQCLCRNQEKFSRRLKEISLYDFKEVICMQDQDIFLHRCIPLDVRF